MASGFGTFDGNAVTIKGYVGGLATIVVSQSINYSERSVTVTATAYPSYKRTAGGNWNVSNGTTFWWTCHTVAYIEVGIEGTTNRIWKDFGVKSSKYQTVTTGTICSVPNGGATAPGVTVSRKFYYNQAGNAISGGWGAFIHEYDSTSGWHDFSVGGNFTTDSIPASGGAPLGVRATYNSSTWNSVNGTTSITSWNGYNSGNLETIIVTGASDADFNTVNANNWYSYSGTGGKGRHVYRVVGTQALSYTFNNMMTNNSSETFDNPLPLIGMRRYYIAAWAANPYGSAPGGYIDMTVRYLPPAPAQFTYADPGGAGTKTFPVSFTGVPANNNQDYDRSHLMRSVRYRIGNGPWVVVDNDTVANVDFVTSFSVPVPPGMVATVEGWMTYHGMQSEVTTITLANTNAPIALYGSVNGASKLLGPVYASVNGRTKKIEKIYASAGGVTKKVYEDV